MTLQLLCDSVENGIFNKKQDSRDLSPKAPIETIGWSWSNYLNGICPALPSPAEPCLSGDELFGAELSGAELSEVEDSGVELS